MYSTYVFTDMEKRLNNIWEELDELSFILCVEFNEKNFSQYEYMFSSL